MDYQEIRDLIANARKRTPVTCYVRHDGEFDVAPDAEVKAFPTAAGTTILIGATTLDAALARFPGVSFLQMARDIARSHHERFDGTGYPDRLAAEGIALSARIVAVADVYDAMTTRRVYKPPFEHEIARSLIHDERGRHFDPEVVDSFERNHTRFSEVHRRLAAHAKAA